MVFSFYAVGWGADPVYCKVHIRLAEDENPRKFAHWTSASQESWPNPGICAVLPWISYFFADFLDNTYTQSFRIVYVPLRFFAQYYEISQIEWPCATMSILSRTILHGIATLIVDNTLTLWLWIGSQRPSFTCCHLWPATHTVPTGNGNHLKYYYHCRSSDPLQLPPRWYFMLYAYRYFILYNALVC